VTKVILRTYGGIFEHLLKINLILIADKASTSEKNVIDILQQLKNDDIVDFQFSNTDSEITFLQPREDDKTINRIAKNVLQHQQLKTQQIEAVIDYVDNTTECKSKLLLDYFGEKTSKDCGICTFCLSKKSAKKSDAKNITHQIIEQLEHQPMNSRQLLEQLDVSEKELIETLKLLVENHILEVTSTNKYKIKHT
jgi:ATP-dependent DNA helicase RecQ